ncbi:hypothetical protein ATO9_19365 [Pseudooceanicola atlanticus]|uniref:RapA2 cadherin-like domain-containing protein n=1 Tax=Pseudooceanicola atlanticus TaxID=1461694 RepID=A0A0A0EAQ7_9RHOB|nr:hypothetical protein ATO9_19365 [Pseudooceanicola atlanticus]
MSLDEWLAIQTSLRADLKALSQQIDAGRDRRWFEFDSLNVKVREFEALRLVVDGKEISWEDSPVSAVNDRIRVSEDRVARGSVLDNDDLGDPLDAVTLISGPSRGDLKLRDDGTFRFKAAGSFDELALGEVAKEVFKYRVTDIDGDSDTARGKIRIVGKNDAPVMAAGEMSAIVDEGGQPLDLTALGSDVDSDDDGATLIYTITGAPVEGQAWLDGSNLYFETEGDMQDLAPGETRDVFVEVTATDQHGASATSTITVTIEGSDQAPVASNNRFTVAEDEVGTFDVLSNDTIIDFGDTFELVRACGAQNGKVAVDIGTVRRAFAPDCLGGDTNQPAGPALRDVMIPERRFSPLGSPVGSNQWRLHGSLSSVLSQQVFQHHVVQHRACQRPFELGILILRRLQPGPLGHFNTSILGPQFVERGGAQPAPAVHLSRRKPGLLFLDHPDYLRLGETALSHVSAPSELAQTQHHGDGFRGGKVNRSVLASWRPKRRPRIAVWCYCPSERLHPFNVVTSTF